MKLKISKLRYPFYVGITTLMVTIILVLSAIFLWISQKESTAAALKMADRIFSEVNGKMIERYDSALASVAVLAGAAARMPGMATPPVGDGLDHPGLELILEALNFYQYLFSLYCGYADGTFIHIMAIRGDPALADRFGAPAETFFVLRTISTGAQGQRRQYWRFLDAQRAVIGSTDDPTAAYDPRSRVWYKKAMQQDTAFYTDPYIFAATKIPGITCAEKLVFGSGVFGADITLARFAESLKRQQVSANGSLFMLDRKGQIIAHPTENPIRTAKQSVDAAADEKLIFLTGVEAQDPLVRSVTKAFLDSPEKLLGKTQRMAIQGRPYLVRMSSMEADLKFDQMMASIAPLSDFTGHIRRMQQRIFLFSGIVIAVVLPLALFMSRRISESLVRLEQEALKVQRFDFSPSEPFDSNIKEIHANIKAFVLMKSTIRDRTDQLIEAHKKLRELFDAFIQLLAGAIDAKSPYTGGHCARVPEIAGRLAKAAHETTEGPFADFCMETKDQWREFNVAAWLHDCGKVTTPEYVVDKATKLETIYDRIHEIRMRFEVLLRDVDIDHYRALLEGERSEKELNDEREEKRNDIIDDFTFVARCNIGGEFMADEKIERLEKIAERTWMRHLDDRLGISEAELTRKSRLPQEELPVIETVLADRADHIIARTESHPFGEDNPYGFKMDVPQELYNLGELYNLSIRKGTLSAEDRFKINEHIIQTLRMLKKLPFPDYLKNVPEIAAAHHETMDGKGYPRKLTKEEMSVPARIMAIADIFEALTATDRPYKKAKTLSESLRIMSFMRNDRHIDAELFELFLKSGVHHQYAEAFLQPEQIDAVDIEQFL